MIKIIFLIITGFCIGVIATIVLDCNGKIRPSLWDFNIIDILSLLTYWLIGIYVAYYLVKRSSDQQIKKRLFLDIVKDIENIFEDNLVFLQSFMEKNTAKEERKS